MVDAGRGDTTSEPRDGWNPAEMEAAARDSEGRECYREVACGEGRRIGVVATALPSSCVLFSLEISLRLCRKEGEVKPVLLERAASLAQRLQQRGYSMNHLDDGWIVCEKSLLREEIASELDYLVRSIRPDTADHGATLPEARDSTRRRRA